MWNKTTNNLDNKIESVDDNSVKTINGISPDEDGNVDVAGGVTSVNGQTGDVTVDEYSLPTATSSVLGGVKVGSNITLSSDTISLTKANVTSALGYTPLQTASEALLSWGGANHSSSFSPVDAGMCPELGTNRFAFGKAAGITIQYSRDAGSTWTDYGATDAQKIQLFSTGFGFNIGKSTTSNLPTTNCMLRVIVDTDAFGIYSGLNKFMFNVTTVGCGGCYVTIEASLESTPTTFVTFADKVGISGWSGWNVVNTGTITTYGNSSGYQYGLLRFTFGCTSVDTNYTGLQVINIKAFGGMGWTTPSTMAKTGNLYSYDYAQNATFPAAVSAPTITATGTLNIPGGKIWIA